MRAAKRPVSLRKRALVWLGLLLIEEDAQHSERDSERDELEQLGSVWEGHRVSVFAEQE